MCNSCARGTVCCEARGEDSLLGDGPACNILLQAGPCTHCKRATACAVCARPHRLQLILSHCTLQLYASATGQCRLARAATVLVSTSTSNISLLARLQVCFEVSCCPDPDVAPRQQTDQASLSVQHQLQLNTNLLEYSARCTLCNVLLSRSRCTGRLAGFSG
jgi:hypothetical protein